jgi:hypothetical protein
VSDPGELAPTRDPRWRDYQNSPDGGLLADYLSPVDDSDQLATRLSLTPGVVEHGPHGRRRKRSPPTAQIHRSGLWAAVDGDVLGYVHKERELDDVERRYPAEHYVIVDDKLRILDAIKHGFDSRVATVFLRQGHYATDVDSLEAHSPADLMLGGIGQLVDALVERGQRPSRPVAGTCAQF